MITTVEPDLAANKTLAVDWLLHLNQKRTADMLRTTELAFPLPAASTGAATPQKGAP